MPKNPVKASGSFRRYAAPAVCAGALIAMLLAVGCDGPLTRRPGEWVTLKNCKFVEAGHRDGDSFRVRCGEEEILFRLYFVDAPETDDDFPDRVREQAKHFGITAAQNRKAGEDAKTFVAGLLADNAFEITTRWQDALGRSTRYYALVRVGKEDLGETLVARGLARVKGQVAVLPSGERPKHYVKTLKKLERQAKADGAGAWKRTNDLPPGDPWWQRWWRKARQFLSGGNRAPVSSG